LGGAAALEVDLYEMGEAAQKTVEYSKNLVPDPCGFWRLRRGSRKLGLHLTAAVRARRSFPVPL